MSGSTSCKECIPQIIAVFYHNIHCIFIFYLCNHLLSCLSFVNTKGHNYHVCPTRASGEIYVVSMEFWRSNSRFCSPKIIASGKGSNPSLNKNSRTFKDTFVIFQGLHSVQKRALSPCLFYFFQKVSNIIILKVYRCLLGSE